MPPRSNTKTKSTDSAPASEQVAAPVTKTSDPAPAPEQAVAPVPAVAQDKKRRASKAAGSAAPVAEPVAAPVADVVPELADTSVAGEQKERVVPTVDSVHTEFAELVTILEQQIAQLRDSADKTGSAKFLRGILRRVKNLQSASSRVMKRKQPNKRSNNSNSGFLKPVAISPEMAKFTGLDASTEHSRVDVTKFLCKYIRDKNLQNDDDRRQIVPDAPLSKLLGYDAKKADKPLTYYHLQTLLKGHFRASEKK